MRQRKRNRKLNFDYSIDGWYFITIVTKNRIHWFGQIHQNQMVLNKYGLLVKKLLEQIPKHFIYANVDAFVLMPNHIHAIIEINNAPVSPVGIADLRSLPGNINDRSKMKLSKIIHGFKSSFTRQLRIQYNDYEFLWHRSFHDRIIRNHSEYVRIKNYIINNPLRWNLGKNN